MERDGFGETGGSGRGGIGKRMKGREKNKKKKELATGERDEEKEDLLF